MMVQRLLLARESFRFPSALRAQLVDDFKPPRGNCCLPGSAQTLADALQDWNQLGRYHAANEELKKQPADPRRVVFMGDSITDIWKLADQFPGKPYVNRGISGQTTPQMLVRMFPDVIDLKPAAVVHSGRHQRHRAQHRPRNADHDRRESASHDRARPGPRHQGGSVLSHADQRL